MKKQQVDHILRAAGRICGERARLLGLLEETTVSAPIRDRIQADIERDFAVVR